MIGLADAQGEAEHDLLADGCDDRVDAGIRVVVELRQAQAPG
jgi:hypothetical protein